MTWEPDPNDDPADQLVCAACGARILHRVRYWVRGRGGDPRPICSQACASAAKPRRWRVTA